MAGLADAGIVNGKSPSNFFSNFVTMLGADSGRGADREHGRECFGDAVQNQVNALSAVNLNDEAVSMQQLERSYQAASQVFAILNTIMASALNLGSRQPCRK